MRKNDPLSLHPIKINTTLQTFEETTVFTRIFYFPHSSLRVVTVWTYSCPNTGISTDSRNCQTGNASPAELVGLFFTRYGFAPIHFQSGHQKCAAASSPVHLRLCRCAHQNNPDAVDIRLRNHRNSHRRDPRLHECKMLTKHIYPRAHHKRQTAFSPK